VTNLPRALAPLVDVDARAPPVAQTLKSAIIAVAVIAAISFPLVVVKASLASSHHSRRIAGQPFVDAHHRSSFSAINDGIEPILAVSTPRVVPTPRARPSRDELCGNADCQLSLCLFLKK
jgi:hypothetical protein